MVYNHQKWPWKKTIEILLPKTNYTEHIQNLKYALTVHFK